MGAQIVQRKSMNMLATKRNVSSAIHLAMGQVVRIVLRINTDMAVERINVAGAGHLQLGQDAPIAQANIMKNKRNLKRSVRAFAKGILFSLI